MCLLQSELGSQHGSACPPSYSCRGALPLSGEVISSFLRTLQSVALHRCPQTILHREKNRPQPSTTQFSNSTFEPTCACLQSSPTSPHLVPPPPPRFPKNPASQLSLACAFDLSLTAPPSTHALQSPSSAKRSSFTLTHLHLELSSPSQPDFWNHTECPPPPHRSSPCFSYCLYLCLLLGRVGGVRSHELSAQRLFIPSSSHSAPPPPVPLAPTKETLFDHAVAAVNGHGWAPVLLLRLMAVPSGWLPH